MELGRFHCLGCLPLLQTVSWGQPKLQALVYDTLPSIPQALVYDTLPSSLQAVVYDILPSTLQALFYDILPSTLQALVYDILHATTALFSYAIGSRKLSANEQFVFGAKTVVSFLQTTQIMAFVLQLTMLLTPAQIKPKSFQSRRNSSSFFFFFFYPQWMRLMCFGATLFLQSY